MLTFPYLISVRHLYQLPPRNSLLTIFLSFHARGVRAVFTRRYQGSSSFATFTRFLRPGPPPPVHQSVQRAVMEPFCSVRACLCAGEFNSSVSGRGWQLRTSTQFCFVLHSVCFKSVRFDENFNQKYISSFVYVLGSAFCRGLSHELGYVVKAL